MTSPKTLLKAWQLRPKKQLGQNFLTDPSTAEMIVSRANISKTDVVLEIGAGLGALTIPLAQNAGKVYAVEKDAQIADLLKTELLLRQFSNVQIIEKDIFAVEISALADQAGRKMIVAGNLPYNISSQILVKLIRVRDRVERGIFMFQKELAQRITSRPGTKNYGRLTAMLRYCADIKTLATVRASLFFPAPKVDSEVIEIRFHTTREYPEHDEAMLFKVIKAAFGNRRKTLKNALAASGLHIDRDAALRALNLAGIHPTRRAETLAPSEFVALEISLRQTLQSEHEKI